MAPRSTHPRDCAFLTMSASRISACLLAGVLAVPIQAQAVTFFVQHAVRADTSVSDTVRESAFPRDDTLFDASVLSQGLSGQGQVSQASASQTVFVDQQHGAFGTGASSLGLAGGVSGEASSTFEAGFNIGAQSRFSLSSLFEASGNAPTNVRIALQRFEDSSTPVDVLLDFVREGFSGTEQQNLAGILDAGFYLFSISNVISNIDPGESGNSRFEFNFRFDALDGANNVPEPSSLALVLGALLAGRSLRRRSSRSGR
jgi:hypothetical protein